MSSARIITENHARKIFRKEECDTDISGKRGAERLIAETDGSMVPIAKTDEKAADKRKTRKVCRKEARLSLSYADGSVTPGFGAVMGSPMMPESLKNNRIEEVLEALHPYSESEKIPNSDAPVTACCRYITNRPGQFDYKNALAKGLPIGSGRIGSAYRYIIQERFTIPGAWWKENNAQNMLSLRVLRADGDRESYRKKADRI